MDNQPSRPSFTQHKASCDACLQKTWGERIGNEFGVPKDAPAAAPRCSRSFHAVAQSCPSSAESRPGHEPDPQKTDRSQRAVHIWGNLRVLTAKGHLWPCPVRKLEPGGRRKDAHAEGGGKQPPPPGPSTLHWAQPRATPFPPSPRRFRGDRRGWGRARWGVAYERGGGAKHGRTNGERRWAGGAGSGDGREGRGAAAARGGARRRPVPLLPRGGRAGTGRAAAACAGVSGTLRAGGHREGAGSPTATASPPSRFSRSRFPSPLPPLPVPAPPSPCPGPVPSSGG